MHQLEEALVRYLENGHQWPSILYLGEKETRMMDREFGGICLGWMDMQLVEVVKQSWIGFGGERMKLSFKSKDAQAGLWEFGVSYWSNWAWNPPRRTSRTDLPRQTSRLDRTGPSRRISRTAGEKRTAAESHRYVGVRIGHA